MTDSQLKDTRNTGVKWAVASAALIVAFYVLREHWEHALGLLPYAILLACPLMHLFHGSHHDKARCD